jgi:hypothetical protein
MTDLDERVSAIADFHVEPNGSRQRLRWPNRP